MQPASAISSSASAARNLELWVRLALAPDVGLVTAHRLIERMGSIEAVFDTSADDWPDDGHGLKKAYEGIHSGRLARAVEEEIAAAEAENVSPISLEHPGYPSALLDLKHPPLVVYARGTLRSIDRLAVSIVGPRKPSDYARGMTKSIVPALCARSLTIVSGLAHGIDAEAHVAALDCQGRTIAVLGQGLGTSIYPSSNRKIAERILREDRGAIVSVFPMATQAQPGLFPRRNEIIAALGLGALIVEAGEGSGALITADHALELGRPVMACPGDATRETSRGSNRLIADGATLIQSADDVLRTLAPDIRVAAQEVGMGGQHAESVKSEKSEKGEKDKKAKSGRPVVDSKPPASAAQPADDLERVLFRLLAVDPRTIDHLLSGCAEAGYSQSAVVQKLLMLELSGRLKQLPGRVYQLLS